MDTKNCNILIIDDDHDILVAAKMALKKHFGKISISTNPGLSQELLNEQEYSCILLDMNYSRGNITGSEGLHWLEKIHTAFPEIPIIMMTAFGDVNLAVDCIKKGATDFILKPWNNEKLVTTIQNSIKLKKANDTIQALKTKQEHINQINLSASNLDLIGQSKAIQQVLKTIEKVAKTNANVLLLGENGTGKGLIAKTIHQLSNRNNETFIKVDLGAIHDNLFDSELFGHKKGSFTGANEDRIGRFELAQNGTLFLDEIGNIDMPFQSKLLSALQNRKIIPVGGNKEIPIDIRLISATNMPLKEMIGEKKFREDLLYRVNTVEIYLPPLRERKEDIYPIAQHYMRKYCQQYNIKEKAFDEATINALENHLWPGNIRELQHAVERAIILSEKDHLTTSDFFFQEQKNVKINEIKFENFNLESIEKKLIEKVLKQYQGNISKAAKELGLTRAALYRRLEKHGL